jgi:4-amino-4-deoxy-L-arabinose transferase-like glycosyltransferase
VNGNGLAGRRWWLACGLVLIAALAASVPTAGDLGLTWDEPAYRYSQLVSAQWWERLGRARSSADLAALLEPDALLYYWPYGRHGINFHPPLAGQLNLLTYEVFGRWMKDIPARRMASVIELALTVTLLFGFLARRYGAWVGGVASASLLLMPRVYGQGHLAETDTPGLLLWAATALAFWKGLHEPRARPWRVAVGVLLGLAFVEKMGAVSVLVPIVAWLVLGHLPRSFARRTGPADWIGGLVTSAAMLAPLGVAYAEILRLVRELPVPQRTNLFIHRPESYLPAAILLVPLAVWLIRRLVGWLARPHPVWGAERPALETWTAILAFAPAVGWLGNPAWWRETLPRLAHYYAASAGRRGTLPDIQILYFGQTYEYSLPWHNAWVLMAITVPVGILAAAVVGLLYAIRVVGRDRLPLYFAVHLATLPALRMLPTPAHDGVRLFLPSFFFLAAFAGWGTICAADGLAGLTRARAAWTRGLLAAAVLGPAAWGLVRVHPFELSYYNRAIGGPQGAWRAGFELSYWYDAFDGRTLADLDERFPKGATVDFLNDMEKSAAGVFFDLQSLGALRGDLTIATRGLSEFANEVVQGRDAVGFPYVWLLTHDSKATAFTRLLFALRPWYARRPSQLGGLRVLTVADPEAVARAWALWLLLDAPDTRPPDRPATPLWVRQWAPWLGRLWGEGVTQSRHLAINEPMLAWAQADPAGLRAAARALAERPTDVADSDARRLRKELDRYGYAGETLLRLRPRALVEAVEILIRKPNALRRVLLRYPYTDERDLGGYLDDRSAPDG